MKEIANSISETIRNRLTNSLYGTFFVSWLIFHWNFIFSIFFLSEDKILEATGLLKNDYLYQKYFNVSNLYFWASWMLPFLITWLIIWILPKWLLIPAYKKTEEYETNKKIIKISEEIKIEHKKVQLNEETAKKFTAVAEKVIQEKKIKEADPTIEWANEYDLFKNTPYYNDFELIVESLYEQKGQASWYKNMSSYPTSIPKRTLAYAHSNNLVEFENNNKNIKLTDKGKFFLKRYSLEKNI